MFLLFLRLSFSLIVDLSFEERAACIERIVKNHKEPTSYEDFASLVFCPVPKPPGSEPPTPTLSAGERHLILRTETAPTTSSLSDSEKTSLRNRSKSVVTSPRLFNNKLGEFFFHLFNFFSFCHAYIFVLIVFILEIYLSVFNFEWSNIYSQGACLESGFKARSSHRLTSLGKIRHS